MIAGTNFSFIQVWKMGFLIVCILSVALPIFFAEMYVVVLITIIQLVINLHLLIINLSQEFIIINL